MSCQMKSLADLVGYGGYALGMRMFIPLKTVCRRGELEKSLTGSFIDQIHAGCSRHRSSCCPSESGVLLHFTTEKAWSQRRARDELALALYFNVRNSSPAFTLFGSAASARSASPRARRGNPRSRYNSASINRYWALPGSTLRAACNSASARRRVFSFAAKA